MEVRAFCFSVFFRYKQAYVGKFGVIVKGKLTLDIVARNYAALLHSRCYVFALTCADSVCMVAGALLCHFNAILVQRSYLSTKITF